MRKVQEHNEKCLFVLVGCKEDLVANEAALAPITQWSDEQGIPFFQTSALKGGHTINFLFHGVAEKCIRRNLDRQLKGSDDNVKLSNQSAFGKPQAAADDMQRGVCLFFFMVRKNVGHF